MVEFTVALLWILALPGKSGPAGFNAVPVFVACLYAWCFGSRNLCTTGRKRLDVRREERGRWRNIAITLITSWPTGLIVALMVKLPTNSHWSRWLGTLGACLLVGGMVQDRLADVRIDIQNRAGSPALLEAAASKLEKAIEASKQPCNTAAVWDTGQLDCSPLVKELLFTSGVVDYAKPGSLASLKSRTVLFYPSRYAYTENLKALPLYVVVDRETWSAAEYFAALLQDNHAATVVGEVTGRAGCGYTNGGIPAELKNSGARLEMPDCVRFRADGSNEVNGITPDVLLAWAEHDSDSQRVKKLLAGLESRQAATAKLPLQ
jgi:hypothetical protein